MGSRDDEYSDDDTAVSPWQDFGEIESPDQVIDDVADESDIVSIGKTKYGKKETPYAMQNVDLFEQLEGERLKEIFKKEKGHEETKPEDLSDFFNMQFSMTPETVSSSDEFECKDADKLGMIDAMLENPDFKRSREYTMLDQIASDIACEETSKQYTILVIKNKKEKDEQKKEQNREQSANQAMKKVQKEVEEYTNTMSAIGAGKGDNGGVSAKRIKELYMKIRHNANLQKIFNLAGRFRMMARSLQRMKVTSGMDEMIGTTLGSEIPKLLPVELGSLASDHIGLRAIACNRLVENNMFELEYEGYEPAAKGPIVVCVDESGSMNGPRIESAKAFCLAMGLIAQMQKRWIAFVSFSCGEHHLSKCCFPPDRWNQDELLQWLTHMYNGGTDCNIPLRRLPFEFWKEWEKQGLQKGKTDIIYVSDGEIDVPQDVADKFNKWKKDENVKVHSIIIQSSSEGFNAVSDYLYNVDCIDVTDKSVQNVMSI